MPADVALEKARTEVQALRVVRTERV